MCDMNVEAKLSMTTKRYGGSWRKGQACVGNQLNVYYILV